MHLLLALLLAIQDAPKSPPPAPAPAGAKVNTEAEADAAIAEFKKAFSKGDLTSTRVDAVKKLAQVKHEKVVRQLVPLLTHALEDVAAQVAVQLGSHDHHAAAEGLAAAVGANLTAKRPVVVAASCSSLGKLGYEATSATLVKLLDKNGDDDVMLILPDAIRAIGQIGSASAVDPLIDLLRKTESTGGGGGPGGGGRGGRGGRGFGRDDDMAKLRGPVTGALRAITGGDADSANGWDQWWKASRAELLAGAKGTWICKTSWDRVEGAAPNKKPACSHAADKGHDSCMVLVRVRLTEPPAPAPPSPRDGGGGK